MNVVLVEVEDARIEPEVVDSVQRVVGGGVTSKYFCDEQAAAIMGIADRRILATSLVIATMNSRPNAVSVSSTCRLVLRA